jgi:two-component system sensor histidine kinase CreC
MKLGARILFSYLLIFGLGFYFLINWVMDDIRTRYLEGVEESLVDQANIMASLVGHEMETKRFSPEELHRVFEKANRRKLNAKIYKLTKTNVELDVYITDYSGKVIFDSQNTKNEGEDYAEWRDVYLTLKGEYGARSTMTDPNDLTSDVLYVAAPIKVNGRLSGVLTVVKPTTNINIFIRSAKNRVIQVGSISVLAVFIFCITIIVWLTRPIKRLTKYANDIRKGKKVTLPKLDSSEIGEMGNAFENMRIALEGKKYVEKYVQTFTHEIKSPLSAIRGAAELLDEDMPPTKRSQFISNIRDETRRIQNIVDRMLQLSTLENLNELQNPKQINLNSLVVKLADVIEPILAAKQLNLELQMHNDVYLVGDEFLLKQALSNLIQNAIDFSPPAGQIRVMSRYAGQKVEVIIEDLGPGIPAYARAKVFKRFFSLERPDSGKKSNGLGLNFVREVALLHKGHIKIENRPQKGVRAILRLPVDPRIN